MNGGRQRQLNQVQVTFGIGGNLEVDEVFERETDRGTRGGDKLYERNRGRLVARNKTNALKSAHVVAGGFAMEAVDGNTELELRRLDVTRELTAQTRLSV